MRLIDRDKTLDILRSTYRIDALDRIENLPTVDAIPVEWLKEKLTNHPELSYAVTDGINNVLDIWEQQGDKECTE